MAIIELQMATSSVLGALTTGIAIATGPAQGQKFTAGGTDYRVNQIRLTGSVSLKFDVAETEVIFYSSFFPHPDGSHLFSDTVPGTRVQFRQELSANLLEVLKDSNGNVTGTQDAGTLTVDLVLHMWATSLGISLGADTVTVNGPAAVEVTQALGKLLENTIPSVTTPIPALSFGTVANAGIAVDKAGSIIAIRIEFGLPLDLQAAEGGWAPFFAGNFPNHLSVGSQSGNVSFFIDSFSIEQMVTQTFSSSLTAWGSKIRLDWGPAANWTPNNGNAHLDVIFNGDVIKACADLWDINCDFHGDVSISLANATNTLLLDNNLSWTPNFWQELGCALFVGVVAGYVFAIIGAAAGPIGAAIGAGIGLIGGLILVFVFVSGAYVPTIPIKQPCTQLGHDVRCTVPVAVPTDPTTGKPVLVIRSVAGAPEGLVLFSELSIGPITFMSAKVTLGNVSQFAWQPPTITCAQVTPHTLKELMANVQQYVYANAAVDLANSGQGTLVVTSVERISPDPAAAFGAGTITIANYTTSCRVSVDAVYNAAYMASPYPCVLLIVTNGGVLTVSLDPIPALDAAALAGIEAQATTMVDACQVSSDSWWQEFHRINLKWFVDPGPDGEQFGMRFTQVQVAGLRAGEAITLSTGEMTDAAGSAATDSRGFAESSLLTFNSAQPLYLGRQVAGGNLSAGTADRTGGGQISEVAPRTVPTNSSAKRSIKVREAAVLECGRVDLGAPCRQIGGYFMAGHATALALAGDILATIDLRNPYQPKLVSYFFTPGVEGFTISSGTGLLLWGNAGLSRLDIGPTAGRAAAPSCHRLSDDPVVGVSSVGNLLAVARNGRIDLLDQGLRQVTSACCTGVIGLARASGNLVSLASNGLEAWQFNLDRSALCPAGRLQLSNLSHVHGSPLITPRTGVFASGPAMSGIIVDFVDPWSPRVTAEYRERPWFLDAATITSLLLLRKTNETSITVATLGPTRTAVDLQATSTSR
jgi:hypothetical protein